MTGNPKYDIITFLFLLWSLVWKGMALWKSAKAGQRNWFLVMLILNTLGLVEIIYLFKFAKHPLTMQEIKHFFKPQKHHK